MSLRVLHPGTFSLLVDTGRPRSRALGIPVGGPADRAAFMLGNLLVGNAPDLPALEMTLSGPVLLAEIDLAVCVFGAQFALRLEGEEVRAGQLFTMRAGQTLRVAGSERGARGYLCVHGGFTGPTILDSATAFEPIAAGDRLGCTSSTLGGRGLPHADVATLIGETELSGRIRVLAGPQADWFDTGDFYHQPYRVAAASNRMGIRLTGEAMPKPDRELVSEAVSPGAVQITNEGLPIILGVDGQTIGGYPKIAHVIRADLGRVGQLRPGQTVAFRQVTMAEAQKIAIDRARRLREWQTRLRM